MKLIWGKKVSSDFREKVMRVSDNLEMNPDHLMACIAFETGETFDPAIINKAGSGATGLIQFMPSTALVLGTTVDQLAKMTAVQQLHYVEKYFQWTKGKLTTLSDVYMAILWPSAIGRSEDYVLFRKNDPLHPKRYIQNAGLDFNKDGVITKAEATAKVQSKYEKGKLPEYFFSEEEISTHFAFKKEEMILYINRIQTEIEKLKSVITNL